MKLTGIGPAIIDYHIHTTIKSLYECSAILQQDIKLGGWYQISTAEDFEQIIEHLAPTHSYIKMAGGSPANALVSASQHGVLSNFITTVGQTQDIDQDGKIFIKSLEIHDIEVHPVLSLGHTAKILSVTIPETRGEKTMFIFEGVKNELHSLPITPGQYVLTDCYEFLHDPMKSTIDRLMDSKKHIIALGLGNFTIVEKLNTYLLEKIAASKIHMLFGNEDEFQKLLGENLSTMEIITHPLLANLTDIILTQGRNGITARSNNEICHQKAFSISKDLIVSTIGAGDAVAGTYLAGTIKDLPLQQRLRNAAHQAGKIIQTEDARLPA
ncbi:hypothetical protein CVV38_03860 [Candidatus Peregrinibacteria bacterium HGW-Peregrinibacteria-1]|jgi:sugar/nucleoside kinase (ribokinase family)|nr:MAG: hypothetical protein CVV38_03860 [Candidatus Peregrinibacteria bacterium HGW-Peregrinibacteria-1]